MLDTRSLVAALVLVLMIGIVLHFVNWRIHPESRSARIWTIGLAVQSTGLLLSAIFSPSHDNAPFFLLVLNSLISLGHVTMLYGTASFAERPFRPWVYWALTGALILLYAYFIYLEPAVMGRAKTIGLSMTLTALLGLSRLPAISRRDGALG